MKIMKASGYSAIELMLALIVIMGTLFITLNISNSMLELVQARKAAQQAYSYAQATVRYIATHQNLLRISLSKDDTSNILVATVSPEILFQEGYIPNINYAVNNLNQIACTIIFYDKNQLQALVYYRDNNDSKKLSQNMLNDGLNHIGSSIGLYSNGSVTGSAKDWVIESSMVGKLFVARGSVDLSHGINPALYYCNGTQISNASYVVNVTSLLTLDNQLPRDDTLHQYSDILHSVDESQSNNRMNNDLNMDYQPQSAASLHSNIIFQNNPDCVIDPTNTATMYDYDPTNNYDFSRANILGCKNRQLGIAVESKDKYGSQIAIVTGFKRGGVNTSGNDKIDNRLYVGEVSAASIQPTMQVAVGSACVESEIGRIAQQSDDLNDVNNLYVSQVVCMRSPTCAFDTNGYCYLPVQSVTINYAPKQAEFQCPTGMFITNLQTDVQNYPDWGSHCCATDGFSCIGNASAHNHYWEGYQAYKDSVLIASYINGANIDGSGAISQPLYLPPASYPDYLLVNRAVIGLVDYGYTCDAICQCPGYPSWATQWQPVITSVTCTNDPSQAVFVVTK